jgi:hypothetical protein
MSAAELLAGSPGPAQRAEAYALLDACDDVDVVLSCIPHLCRLLAMPAEGETPTEASQRRVRGETPPAEGVSREEFRRVGRTLASLTIRGSDARLTAAVYQCDWRSYWHAEHSAMGQVLTTAEAGLQIDDVLVLASVFIPSYAIWCWGLAKTVSFMEGGQMAIADMEMEAFLRWLGFPLFRGALRPTSDAYNTRLVRLALEALARSATAEDGGPHRLAEIEQMGVWILIHHAVFSRPAVGKFLLKEHRHFIDAAVAWVRQVGPTAWLTTTSDDSWRSAAVSAVQEAACSAQSAGFDPVPELLRSGYLDMLVEGLCVWHEMRPSTLDVPTTYQFAQRMFAESGFKCTCCAAHQNCSHQVASIFYNLGWNFSMLDLSAHDEAWQKLEACADALDYAMRQDIVQGIGLTTRPFLCMVCTNVFGRAESEVPTTLGRFRTQIQLIDD